MMVKPPKKVVGLCFDHMHMGDLLASAQASAHYEIVGVYDTQPDRMAEVCSDLKIASELQFYDWQELLEKTSPDLGIICSPTAEHKMWTQRLAAQDIHVLLEKPFAVNADEAQACIDATTDAGVQLAINWPLAWYPPHRTTQRLIAEGVIGDVTEVHYYDGNRGPQYHLHAKREVEDPTDVENMWWFDPRAGGGSLLDYLGYGVTLATWMRQGKLPHEVSATTHVPNNLRVDTQSIVIASYDTGLSSFQTRWGTFTDPWIIQPQPFCGFTVVGTEGTIVSRDYASEITVQTNENPEPAAVAVDSGNGPDNIFGHLHEVLENGNKVEGPCGSEVSLGAQRIADAAIESVNIRQPTQLSTAQ